MDASALLADVKILPVITIENAESAAPLARALYGAGARAVEITLRTPAALDALRATRKAVPQMIAGAGSVRRAADFARAREAGAHFAVSPGATAALCAAADAADLPWLPGANTASECMALLARGYRLQKFFPAEASGGIAALQALSAPLPELKFSPSGGITAANAAAYLALPCVQCIGASWFAPAEYLRTGDFERIGELARAAFVLAAGE